MVMMFSMKPVPKKNNIQGIDLHTQYFAKLSVSQSFAPAELSTVYFFMLSVIEICFGDIV
jgi:hypothetical protein